MKLYAWIGEDESGSGVVGLKQGIVPAGCIALVAIDRQKIDVEYIRVQLQAQANASGKPIMLAEFELVDANCVVLRPR